MVGIIDRFEGDYAVVEWNGSEMKDIPRSLLPKECKEGDVIEIVDGKYVLNSNERVRLKKEIDDLAKDLWE